MCCSKVAAAPPAAILLLALASSASAARMLQQNVPSQCDPARARWDDDDINCYFKCPSGGYELDCDTENSIIRCKFDKENSNQDAYFNCPFPAFGQSMDCSRDIQTLSSYTDSCVKDTVAAIGGAWKAVANSGSSAAKVAAFYGDDDLLMINDDFDDDFDD